MLIIKYIHSSKDIFFDIVKKFVFEREGFLKEFLLMYMPYPFKNISCERMVINPTLKY